MLVDVCGSWVDLEWDEFIVQIFLGLFDFLGMVLIGVLQIQVYFGLDQWFIDKWLVWFWWEYYDDYEIMVDNQFLGGGYDFLNVVVSYQLVQLWLSWIDLLMINLFDNEYYYFFGGSWMMVINVMFGLLFQVCLIVLLDF